MAAPPPALVPLPCTTGLLRWLEAGYLLRARMKRGKAVGGVEGADVGRANPDGW